MCKVCRKPREKWFYGIVKTGRGIQIKDIREACDRAFGMGIFDGCLYPNGEVNKNPEVKCQVCAEKYYISRYNVL